jgi:hypothetical protein
MRSLASIVLGFEALVLALVTPVMISVADVKASIAIPLCLGLAVLAVVAAGLLRNQVGYFVVPVMFLLGLAFAGFWVMAYVLGKRIDEAKKAHQAEAG